MSHLDPALLAQWTYGQWRDKVMPDRISGFCQDTRKLMPGDCFVALKTGLRDGHDFLGAAQVAGASCALVSGLQPGPLPQLKVDDPLTAFQTIATEHRRAFTGKVVGITGSCGKTTTKDLLSALLGEHTLSTLGNLNNLIGVPLTLTRIDSASHSFAVVEAGISEPGEMDMLARMIEADAAICTLVGPAHIEQLGGLDGVAREKSRLLHHTRTDAPVYFPAGCLQYSQFQSFGDRARVAAPPGSNLPKGSFQQLEYTTTKQQADGSCRLTIESAASLVGDFDLPFSSPGLVSNAVLALTAAHDLGVDNSTLQARLHKWQPGSHRGQWVRAGDVLIYDDCYNANPASLLEAAQAFDLSAPQKQPRLYVLGCMRELGDVCERMHRETAERLPVRPQDRVICIGPEAQAYADGLSGRVQSIEIFENIEDTFSVADQFSGTIFLKGSRSYKLEQLLQHIIDRKEDSC